MFRMDGVLRRARALRQPPAFKGASELGYNKGGGFEAEITELS
jgi:hypothetical protein